MNACITSARVFITNGPAQATGSRIGRPPSTLAINALLPHMRAGKLRFLGVADAQRSRLLPDVPTIAEALPLPGYEVQLWYGVLAPAGTPRPIVDRLNAEINKLMRDPQVQKDKLVPLGLEGVGTTPERLAEVLAADIPKYVKAARAANITPE